MRTRGEEEEEEEGRETKVEGEEEGMEEGKEESRETKVEGAVDSGVVPLEEAVMWTLDFVRPFSEEVHREYVESNGGGWGWTLAQRNCIAM